MRVTVHTTADSMHGVRVWEHRRLLICLLLALQPLDWSVVHIITTTLPQFLQHSTGFQCIRELCSGLCCWCGNVLMALLPATLPVASASGRHYLRSASTGLIQVPRARIMIGQRSLAVAESSLWNSLPAALRGLELTLHTFKWQLKACLFHVWCANEQKEHPPPPGTVVAFFCDSGAGSKLPSYFPAIECHHSLTDIELCCLVKEAHRCK